jgi:hypothetical protein
MRVMCVFFTIDDSLPLAIQPSFLMEEKDCMVFKKSILNVVCAVGVCGVVQGADGPRTPDRRPQAFVAPDQKALHAGNQQDGDYSLLVRLYAFVRQAIERGDEQDAHKAVQDLVFKISAYNATYVPMVTVASLAVAYISQPAAMDMDSGGLQSDGETASTAESESDE